MGGAPAGASVLTWCSVEGDSEVLTYGELERRSGLLAGWLAAGVPDGAVLGLIPGNDIPSVIAIVAACRLGMPCLVLSPNDPVPRLRAVASRHDVGRVLRSPFVAEHASDIADPIPDAGLTNTALVARSIPATHPALLFGTSGSTAASKIVVQPHRALTSNADAVRAHHGLDRETVILGGLPTYHVNGVHFTVVAPLHAGAHVALPQEIFPYSYHELVDVHQPHIASVVPTVLEALLLTSPHWRPPASLRYFVSAAAPLTRSLINRVCSAYGVRVIQGYGLSETTNFSTTVPVDLPADVYREVAMDADLPSVGIALPGNEVEVLADGAVLGERQRGEICMRGHNVMTKYADAPELTAQAFADGWFHSGDLGYWARARDGRRYFYLTGRSKNIAKVRGETVSLEEVERALLSLGSVIDAACVAAPHPTWGEQILALVRLGEGDHFQVRAELRTLLPAVAVPSRLVECDAVPWTRTGKIIRLEVAQLLHDYREGVG